MATGSANLHIALCLSVSASGATCHKKQDTTLRLGGTKVCRSAYKTAGNPDNQQGQLKQRSIQDLKNLLKNLNFLQVPSMNISKTSDLNFCLIIPHSPVPPAELFFFRALPPQVTESQPHQLNRLESE